MDPQAGGSFIPKKPLVESAHSGGVGLLMVVALFLFVVSLLAAGAAFGYQRYLDSAIVDKQASLKKDEAAFALPTVQLLVRTDTRINETKKLLAKHVSVSGLFNFLSVHTLERVQFTDFSYSQDGDTVKLSLSGSADSFSTVALQSDEFGKAKSLRDVVFSGIVIEAGRVNFQVSANVDPTLVLYSSYITAGAQSQTQTQAPAAPQTLPPATTTATTTR